MEGETLRPHHGFRENDCHINANWSLLNDFMSQVKEKKIPFL